MRGGIAVALVFLASVALAAAEQETGAKVETRRGAVLRIWAGGDPVTVTALVGSPVRFEDREAGATLEFVVSLEAGDFSGEHALLEAYEIIGSPGQANLVQSTRFDSTRPIVILGNRLAPAQVELIALRDIPIETSGMRPLNCCITCGTETWCGFCVEAPCGACCTF